KKTGDCPQAWQKRGNVLAGNVGRNLAKAPRPGEDCGSDAESYHVSQRIQLAAKIAHRVSHARDAPIETIAQNRKSDGLRGIIKMPRSLMSHSVLDGPVYDLENRVIPEKNVRGGEQ